MAWVTLWSKSGTLYHDKNTAAGIRAWYRNSDGKYIININHQLDGGNYTVGLSTVPYTNKNVRVKVILSGSTYILTTTEQSLGDTVGSHPYRMIIEENIPSPPSTPSSITVPTTLEGGKSYTISWGSGSGATSYRLERSVNGGSYTQIYNGITISYTDTMLTSWNTVTYRVRSYNSDGYSSYRTSPTRTVIQNTAPTTPSSISVPELKSGKPSTISWDASTDADGDTIDYYLERSINGGGYSVIRSGGTSISYSDTPDKSWNTVQYRVRAYDGKVYSSYRTSSTITVKHFPEMKIRVDGALKTSEDGWVRVDGQLRKIDGIWIRVNGVLKEV